MAIIEINRNPSPRQLREFAVSWIVVLGLLGLLSAWRSGQYWPAAGLLWIGAGTVGALGLARPPTIRPFYLALLYVTLPIGWVFSHMLLGAIYYLAITPTGLIIRWFRKDPMARRPDPTAQSYWAKLETPEATDRYFRQY